MALRKWDLDGPDVEKLDVADVCKYLGNIKRQTLSRMIREGKFPRGRRIGGRLVWTGRDIAAYELLADRWFPEPQPPGPGTQPEGQPEARPPRVKKVSGGAGGVAPPAPPGTDAGPE